MNTVTTKNVLSSFINECIKNKNTDADKLKIIIAELKKNKMLSEAYFAIDNLQYGISKDNLREYVINHINILKKNKKALKPIDNIKVQYATKIDEDIEFLLKNKRTAKNYDLWESKVFRIVDHIKENTDMVSKNFDKEKLLESLKQLPENHKIIIEQLTSTEDKKGFYENFKEKCLDNINLLLKEEKDNTNKLLLYEVKDKVNSFTYSNKKYVEDIVKINRINEMLD